MADKNKVPEKYQGNLVGGLFSNKGGTSVADKSKGEVEIHGKIYLTVARRIDDFRKSAEFK